MAEQPIPLTPQKTITNNNQDYRYFNNAGGSFAPNASLDDTIRRAIDMNREATRPAIGSLESSIPEITQKFAAQRTQTESRRKPMQDRYANLISELKGNQQVETNRQTLTTNNELARRGILPSSGVADQQMTESLNPITSKYSGLIKDTGIAQEESLLNLDQIIAGLTGQETEATRSVRNAIAQLESGAAQSGMSLGTNIYNTNIENAMRQRQMEEATRQAAIDEQIKRQQMEAASRQAGFDNQFRERELQERLRQQQIENERNKSVNLGSYFNTGSATQKPSAKPTVKPTVRPTAKTVSMPVKTPISSSKKPAGSFAQQVMAKANQLYRA